MGGRSRYVCHNRDSLRSETDAMSHLSEQILQTVEALSAEDQRQVLDFVEFLWTKRQKADYGT